MDWDVVLNAAIGAAAAAFPSFALALLARREARRARAEVHNLHVQINSRMDDWLAAAEAAARQEGLADGVEAERVRLEEP